MVACAAYDAGLFVGTHPGQQCGDCESAVATVAPVKIEEQPESAGGDVVPIVDLRVTNLAHFRVPMDFEALPQGAFTTVKKLASGILGDVFQCRWARRSGSEEEAPLKKQRTSADEEEFVAVKKLRGQRLRAIQGTETDEWTMHMKLPGEAPEAEDALSEIGVLQHLAKHSAQCPYILKLRGVFAGQEDNSVWLVTDFAEGGDLFDVAAAGAVAEPRLRQYGRQLYEAVAFLHDQGIAHRDISLENILLKQGSLRLMDFGMAVSSHAPTGQPLRFFRAVGKASYRAPEVYCPSTPKTWAVAPFDLEPGRAAMVETSTGHLCQVLFPADAKLGRGCMGEVYGYEAQSTDLFSCGVCLFMLAWQCPPWNVARLSDAMFSFVHGKGFRGLDALLKHWKRQLISESGMAFVKQALQADPCKRPTAAECLEAAWLAEGA